tara:strand:- start:426 stop:578 length:153 start_codon:yes stop_codon:yes gene_type:complete
MRHKSIEESSLFSFSNQRHSNQEQISNPGISRVDYRLDKRTNKDQVDKQL